MKDSEIEKRAAMKQNEADQRKLQEEHERLERELKEEEVTYSIGDRFKSIIKSISRKYILVKLCSAEVGVACLGDGTAYGIDTIKPRSCYKITQAELEKIVNNPDSYLTRYWDSQKKERV